MKGSYPARMRVYGIGFSGRNLGLYAPQPLAIPIAPLHLPEVRNWKWNVSSPGPV
jgi:hypothetical protein